MYKEIMISIVIIIIVIVGDLITQHYTKKSVDILTKTLNELKVSLNNKDMECSKKLTQEIERNLKKIHKKLA